MVALRKFESADLLQIAMPLGGIGAGCISITGYGALTDLAIRNQPASSALPDQWNNRDAAFALLRVNGSSPQTLLVEGPLPPEKIFDQGLKSQGLRDGGHEGLPRFGEVRFEGGYPFGHVYLSDPRIPLAVKLTGWSPFIPGDDVNSGIPAAILQYTITNTGDETADYEFSYHLSHLAEGTNDGRGMRNAALPGMGVCFTNNDAPDAATYGSAAFGVAGHAPRIKSMWLRGGWFDSLSALWREVSTGTFTENTLTGDDHVQGRNGGSIMLSGQLAPGESVTCPIIITWYFPNSYVTEGVQNPELPWHPFYTTQWKDAADVLRYVCDHYQELLHRTTLFQETLLSSTLRPEVLDAVSANLAILKSPTVLRQANGNLWAWEGCFPDRGCCPGSCTHVWNYAQALPHLFPKLERTLREQEYLRSMDERGHINFRAALPDGPVGHNGHPAADGQLGGILKLYRDWQINADIAWLESLYPLAKLSLDYCIDLWDPDRIGAVVEPHHNTYDIEFWGPDGMCSSVYVASLSAFAKLARALGRIAEAEPYEELAERGARFMDLQLFNGEYFEQRIQWDNLRDASFRNTIAESKTDARLEILRVEGPAYQYGSGCLSDGVIGAWMAAIYGVQTPLSQANIVSHLASVYRHNFKHDLRNHASTQRPGYALGAEAGLLLCSWPRQGKPTLPFVYSDEVWTGIEYQVASHLIHECLVEEGLSIVRAVRSRYNGRVRNPWNEYECGSFYARAMASYALLAALSGFHYSAVTRTLAFGPKLDRTPDGSFTCFFATESGWGSIALDDDELSIAICEGELAVHTLELTVNGETRRIETNVTATPGAPISFSLGLA